MNGDHEPTPGTGNWTSLEILPTTPDRVDRMTLAAGRDKRHLLLATALLAGIIIGGREGMAEPKNEVLRVMASCNVLSRLISNLDHLLEKKAETLAGIRKLLSQVQLSNCSYEDARRIASASRFYEGERAPVNTLPPVIQFRFGDKERLVVLGYIPSAGQFPPEARFVKWKKVADDFK